VSDLPSAERTCSRRLGRSNSLGYRPSGVIFGWISADTMWSWTELFAICAAILTLPRGIVRNVTHNHSLVRIEDEKR
jgi:hypothetical protein